MQKHTTKPLVHATHDMCARASYYNSSICHPRRVAYMQEHITTYPVRPWSILNRARKTQGLPLVSPPYSHHQVSSTYHFVRCAYARASQFISSRRQPQRMSCMQEHDTYVAYKTHPTQSFMLGDPYRSTKPKAYPWYASTQLRRFDKT